MDSYSFKNRGDGQKNISLKMVLKLNVSKKINTTPKTFINQNFVNALT